MRLSRVLLWAIAINVVLTLALPVVIFLLSSSSIVGITGQMSLERLIVCSVLSLIYLLIALGCAAAIENGRAPRLMRSGIAIGGVALVGWCVIIFSFDDPIYYDVATRVLIWPSTWPPLMMLIGVTMLRQPQHKSIIVIRRLTIVVLALTAAFICVAVTARPQWDYARASFDAVQWSKVRSYEETATRMGGILLLLCLGGVATVLLSAVLPQRQSQAAAPSTARPYWLRCPRCAHEQHGMTGGCQCAQCGLRIRVEVA